jgi:sugar phosphate isomerase/epimerase
MDSLALLRKAHDLGLHLVQICDNLSYYGMSRAELESIDQYASGLGIAISLGTRGVAPAHLMKVLDYAQPLHADTLRTVIDNADPDQVADGLKSIVPALAEAKVTLVLENTEILDAREIAAIIQAVGSPWVRICLDTANSLGREQRLEEVVAALGPYVRMIHYKDYAVQRVAQAPPVVRMGFEIVGRAAGDGWVDVNWLLRTVAEHDNTLDVVLELWPPFLGTIGETVRNEQEWVERSVSFLKAHIQES